MHACNFHYARSMLAHPLACICSSTLVAVNMQEELLLTFRAMLNCRHFYANLVSAL